MVHFETENVLTLRLNTARLWRTLSILAAFLDAPSTQDGALIAHNAVVRSHIEASESAHIVARPKVDRTS